MFGNLNKPYLNHYWQFCFQTKEMAAITDGIYN